MKGREAASGSDADSGSNVVSGGDAASGGDDAIKGRRCYSSNSGNAVRGRVAFNAGDAVICGNESSGIREKRHWRCCSYSM